MRLRCIAYSSYCERYVRPPTLFVAAAACCRITIIIIIIAYENYVLPRRAVLLLSLYRAALRIALGRLYAALSVCLSVCSPGLTA